jgi:hypothetical protein
MFRCPYGAFGGDSLRSLCADDDDSVAPTGLGSFWRGVSRTAPLARLVLG